MYKTAQILFLLSLLLFPTSSWANSANININSRISSNSNSGSQSFSSSNSRIDISQSGEGTSKVTINGKEYKVEGPGELHVNNSSDSTNTPTEAPQATTQHSDPSPTITTPPQPTQSTQPDISESIEEIEEKQQGIIQEIFSFIKRLTDLISKHTPKA